MAKKSRTMTLDEPTDADFEAAASETGGDLVEDGTLVVEPVQDPDPVAVEPRAVTAALIEVPVLETQPRYEECTARVDLTLWRTSPEFYTMCRVRLALAQQGQTLRDGRKIDSNADVVRWVLERLEDVLQAAQGN